MDDAWAVVWGAVIALVASVIGGFMTSVIGPLVARRAERRSRERTAEEERRATVQKAIYEASVAVRAYAVAPVFRDHMKTFDAMNVVEEHMLTLRLWTTHDERHVEECLSRVMAIKDPDLIAPVAWAWEQVAARWFRGDVSNSDFVDEFERTADERIELYETRRRDKAKDQSDSNPSANSGGSPSAAT